MQAQNLGGGVSEIPYFAVFFEVRPLNLGGDMSHPKSRDHQEGHREKISKSASHEAMRKQVFFEHQRHEALILKGSRAKIISEKWRLGRPASVNLGVWAYRAPLVRLAQATIVFGDCQLKCPPAASNAVIARLKYKIAFRTSKYCKSLTLQSSAFFVFLVFFFLGGFPVHSFLCVFALFSKVFKGSAERKIFASFFGGSSLFFAKTSKDWRVRVAKKEEAGKLPNTIVRLWKTA